jgi:hypothetical protein
LRRFAVVWAFVACALFSLGLGVGAVRAAPPGATARCSDGTYSFSQHRSGTCSHHGGVAAWLAASAARTRQITVGTTVALSRRSKTSHCTLGAEPDRRCSPGAYSSGLTKVLLCSASFHTSSIRNVSNATKHAIETEYGMTPRAYGSTLEIDHIVSLELGGSNDPANLFPERANAHPGYHVKDRLENAAHAWVCQGKIDLRTAQQKIATNWEAFYKLLFGTAPVG